jgi:hypothetical protein
MKKLLIATNVITTCILYFYACKSSNVLNPKTITQKTCYNCLTDETFGHTTNEFTDVVSRYKTNYTDVIEDSIKRIRIDPDHTIGQFLVNGKFSDTRSVWYPIDSVKKFICTIEKYSSIMKIPGDSLGISFYFAQYGNITDNNRKDYSYHHTLFLVPTMRNGGGNFDFDPRYSVKKRKGGDTVITPVTLSDIILNTSISNSYNFLSLGGADMALEANKMKGCPPNCDTPSTLKTIDVLFPNGNPLVKKPIRGN